MTNINYQKETLSKICILALDEIRQQLKLTMFIALFSICSLLSLYAWVRDLYEVLYAHWYKLIPKYDQLSK